MAEADDREAILQLFFDFGRQFFEYSAIFVVHGDLAEGRDAFGSGAPRDRVLAIGVPLDIPSFLRTARERAVSCGTFPDASGLDAVLMADLRRDARSQVLVVPIVVRSRAVAFFVADDGATGISPSAQADVIAAATLAGRQFERLIVRMKLHGLTGRAAAAETRPRPPRSEPPRSHRDPAVRKAAMQALGQALQPAAPPQDAAQQEAPPEPSTPPLPAPVPAAPAPPSAQLAAPPPASAQPVAPPQPAPPESARPVRAPPPLPAAARRSNTLPGHPAVSPQPPPVEPAPPTAPRRQTQPDTPAAKTAPAPLPPPRCHTRSTPSGTPPSRCSRAVRTKRTATRSPRSSRPASQTRSLPSIPAPTDRSLQHARCSAAFRIAHLRRRLRRSGILRAPRCHERRPTRTTRPRASDRFIARDSPSRPPPADLRQARLLRSIDALTAQFVQAETPELTPVPPPSDQSVVLPPHHPPPSRTLKPLPSVIVDMTAQVERLTEAFLTNPKDEQAEVELLRIGQQAMPSIMKHFPGPITIMRDTLDDTWPRVTECGPILRLIAGQRRVALPFVLARTEDPDTETRFWATFLLTGSRTPMPSLRLWPACSTTPSASGAPRASSRTCSARRRPPRWSRSPHCIVGDPKATSVRRVVTIDALGEMRDPLVVPILLGALSYDDEDIGIAVRRALVLVTRQDFGRDSKKWLAWWRSASGRHRIEWLIDALTHDLPALRRAAGQELTVRSPKSTSGTTTTCPRRTASAHSSTTASGGRTRARPASGPRDPHLTPLSPSMSSEAATPEPPH